MNDSSNSTPRDLEGKPITIGMLPSPTVPRWSIQRKAVVVAAVDGGLITRSEVLSRYKMTGAEFRIWRAAVAAAREERAQKTI